MLTCRLESQSKVSGQTPLGIPQCNIGYIRNLHIPFVRDFSTFIDLEFNYGNNDDFIAAVGWF